MGERGPKVPVKKEEVETIIEETWGNISEAARRMEVPTSTFYNWMDMFGLKAFPDKVKRKIAVDALNRVRYLALAPQNQLNETGDKSSPAALLDVLKKWGRYIEYEEPAQKVDITNHTDVLEEAFKEIPSSKDLKAARDRSKQNEAD